MPNRLKIAVVSPADPYNIKTWSGSSYFMMKSLEKYCGDVDYLGPINILGQSIRKQIANGVYRYSGTRYYPERTISASKYFGQVLSQRINEKQYDLVFAPAASVEIANLETNLPVVYVSDATFKQVNETYSIFSSLSSKSLKEEDQIEQSALNHCSMVFYPSHWAAESAINNYGVGKDKVFTVPFGANLSSPPSYFKAVNKSINGSLQLLFLGKEWDRKGGPVAFETLKALIELGVKTKLTVCGVQPPIGYSHPNMEVFPYLDKSNPTDLHKLHDLFSKSHFLILPSTAECYGVVFCEANAYGLPVLAKEVGGIPTIVKEGVNGYLFPRESSGKEFAKKAAQIIGEPKEYSSLNRKARNRFAQFLNWDSWGTTVRSLTNEQLNI